MSTTNFSNDPSESPGVKDQAQQAAGTAADEGKRVAGVAQDEVRKVTAETQDQLRGLLDQATTQVDEQSRTQKTRLAETVRSFGDDLESMSSNDDSGGLAAQVTRQVAQQARGIASHLDDREPRELLDDVRDLARRRPGTFLLGALAAGVVVGRVARGAKAAQDDGGRVQPSTPAVPSPTAASPSTSAPSAGGPAADSFPLPTDAASAGADTNLSGPAGTPSAVGPKGVEISETGVPSSHGGRA